MVLYSRIFPDANICSRSMGNDIIGSLAFIWWQLYMFWFGAFCELAIGLCSLPYQDVSVKSGHCKQLLLSSVKYQYSLW